jgi:hypothetical protein
MSIDTVGVSGHVVEQSAIVSFARHPSQAFSCSSSVPSEGCIDVSVVSGDVLRDATT